MRKICSECIHEDVCKDWEKGFTSFTGILPSNKELSCKNFAALSSGKPGESFAKKFFDSQVDMSPEEGAAINKAFQKELSDKPISGTVNKDRYGCKI